MAKKPTEQPTNPLRESARKLADLLATTPILVIDGVQWRLQPGLDPNDVREKIKKAMHSDTQHVVEVMLAIEQPLVLNCALLSYVYVGGEEGFETSPSVKLGDVVKPLG
jgi:hypothetical protein